MIRFVLVMASQKKPMMEVTVTIEDARVGQEEAVEIVEPTATLIGDGTTVTETDEIVVWGSSTQGIVDGTSKKRIAGGPPFNKDEHSRPKVKTAPKTNIPLKFTGHLPNLGTVTKTEEERLQSLYGRIDGESYLIQKNRHATRGKFYVTVKDAQTLRPKEWINDSILNFVWVQLTERFQGQQENGIRIGFFPCFF